MDYIPLFLGRRVGHMPFLFVIILFFNKKDFSNKRKMYDKIFDVINGPISLIIGLFSHLNCDI